MLVCARRHRKTPTIMTTVMLMIVKTTNNKNISTVYISVHSVLPENLSTPVGRDPILISGCLTTTHGIRSVR